MKLRSSYWGILFYALLLSGAQAAEHVNLSPLIKEKSSCFSGGMKDYDTWIAHITKGKSAKERSVILHDITRADFNRYQAEITCMRFSYEVDGLVVDGFYAMPNKKTDQPLPAVIFNRGGNGDFGKINSMVNYRRLMPLAAQGYFVIASQYRGSNGKANNGVDEFGGRDVNDVLKLVEIIDSNSLINSKKIALFGGSRGGMMALLAAKQLDRFSTIIIASTPIDLLAELNTTHGKRMENNVFKKRIPAYKKNKQQELTNRSAIYWADKLNPKTPILILHSRDDDRVDPANTLRFASRLQELNFPYKLVIYDTGGHTLETHRAEMNQEVFTWLKTYLH